MSGVEKRLKQAINKAKQDLKNTAEAREVEKADEKLNKTSEATRVSLLRGLRAKRIFLERNSEFF